MAKGGRRGVWTSGGNGRRGERVFRRVEEVGFSEAGFGRRLREGLGRWLPKRGLAEAVRGGKSPPLSGDLFLFLNKVRTRAKVLLWDGTGLAIYAKRLERGLIAGLPRHRLRLHDVCIINSPT